MKLVYVSLLIFYLFLLQVLNEFSVEKFLLNIIYTFNEARATVGQLTIKYVLIFCRRRFLQINLLYVM